MNAEIERYFGGPEQPKGFVEWMDKVNRSLMSKLGIGVLDCRDRCYRDAFDDGLDVEEFITEEWGEDPAKMMFEELFG